MTAAAKSIVNSLLIKSQGTGIELPVNKDKVMFNGTSQCMVVNDHADAATMLQRMTPKLRAIGEWDIGRGGAPGQPPNFNIRTDKGQKGDTDGTIRASATPMGMVHLSIDVVGASAKTDASRWVWGVDDQTFTMVKPDDDEFPNIPDGYIQEWHSGLKCRVYELSPMEKNILAGGGGIVGEIVIGDPMSIIIASAGAETANRTCHEHIEFTDLTVEITSAVTGGPVTLSIKNGGSGGTDFSAGGVVIPASAAKGLVIKLTDSSTILAAQAELHEGELYSLISKTVTAITAGTARVTAQFIRRLGR